jgi:hypothetical protein
MKIKPEIKARWFELADEMVDYKCTGQLRRIETRDKQEVVCYCFLGLLGLAVQEVLGVGEFRDKGTSFLNDAAGNPQQQSMPLNIFNLITEEPVSEAERSNLVTCVFTLNDHKHLPFPEIREQIKDMV